MTVCRVVAAAARVLWIVGLLWIVAGGPAPARLDALERDLLPGTGHLLRPETAHWPLFAAAIPHAADAGFSLDDIRTIPPTADSPRPPRRLTARQQRNLRHRLATTLPRYNRLFAHAGRTYDFPSAFIAAVAYIESKWRPGHAIAVRPA